MAPGGCPAAFRRRVIDLVEAGRPVAQVTAELRTSDQSILLRGAIGRASTLASSQAL